MNLFDVDNGGTALPVADTDGDNINNFRDLDSDNDGIIDNVEGQTTAQFQAASGTDTDQNGWDNRYDANNGGTPITLANFDQEGDGPDYLDLNADGDGQPDWVEGFDDDENGDALSDLILRANTFETAAGDPGFYISTTDTDNDNVPDFMEDADGDGLPNFLDPDNAFYRDTDRDGLVDLYDTDNFGATITTPSGHSNVDADAEPDFRDLDVSVGLPVELLAFTAEKVEQEVALEWSTLTEINNDYFTIERSTDGIHFEPLLKVPGAGNSTTRINYVQYDAKPHLGYNYYRLVQTDFDGVEERFNIDVVYFTAEPEAASLLVFPNPSAGDAVYLQLDQVSKGQYRIEILNQFGQRVRGEQFTVESEQQTFQKEILQGQSLASGVYYLRMIAVEGLTTDLKAVRFIVK